MTGNIFSSALAQGEPNETVLGVQAHWKPLHTGSTIYRSGSNIKVYCHVKLLCSHPKRFTLIYDNLTKLSNATCINTIILKFISYVLINYNIYHE